MKRISVRGFRLTLVAAGAVVLVAMGSFALMHTASLEAGADEWLRTPSRSIQESFTENQHTVGESISPDARQMIRRIAASDDAKGMPFVIIDKRLAQLYVFDGEQRLQATSAVLIGFAKGDDTTPGIGDRKIEEVRPEERTTPAGRFNAERGKNLRGEDVVWVDYDSGVSMHRVLTTKPEERRVERLATPTPSDNRISYGCINVPAAFFDQHIVPLFSKHKAVVYVLPEEKTIAQVFGPAPTTYADIHRGSSDINRSFDALVMLLLARRVSQ